MSSEKKKKNDTQTDTDTRQTDRQALTFSPPNSTKMVSSEWPRVRSVFSRRTGSGIWYIKVATRRGGASGDGVPTLCPRMSSR